MRAHEFVTEAVRMSLVRKYMKDWREDKTKYQSEFMRSGYKTDKNATRLIIPITIDQIGMSGITANPTPTERKVTQLLASKGYDVIDYKQNQAREQTGSKREMNIGKILGRIPEGQELKLEFERDPIRAASRPAEYVVVVSRHPYDVIGMSSGRGWTSCMALPKTGSPSDANYAKGGCNQHYLAADVTEGTLVAYLVNTSKLNKTDDILKSPVARIAIKPYVNANGKTMLRPSDEIFGVTSAAFTSKVKAVVAKLNSLLNTSTGEYKLTPTLYAGRDPAKTDYNSDPYATLYKWKEADEAPDDPDLLTYELTNRTGRLQGLAINFRGINGKEMILTSVTEMGEKPFNGWHVDILNFFTHLPLMVAKVNKIDNQMLDPKNYDEQWHITDLLEDEYYAVQHVPIIQLLVKQSVEQWPACVLHAPYLLDDPAIRKQAQDDPRVAKYLRSRPARQ